MSNNETGYQLQTKINMNLILIEYENAISNVESLKRDISYNECIHTHVIDQIMAIWSNSPMGICGIMMVKKKMIRITVASKDTMTINAANKKLRDSQHLFISKEC